VQLKYRLVKVNGKVGGVITRVWLRLSVPVEHASVLLRITPTLFRRVVQQMFCSLLRAVATRDTTP
jgi:multidrug resistance efflux pump